MAHVALSHPLFRKISLIWVTWALGFVVVHFSVNCGGWKALSSRWLSCKNICCLIENLQVTFVVNIHVIAPYSIFYPLHYWLNHAEDEHSVSLSFNFQLVLSFFFFLYIGIHAVHNRNVTISAEKMGALHKPPKCILDLKSQRTYVFKVDLFSKYKLHLNILSCDLILYKRKCFVGSDFLIPLY